MNDPDDIRRIFEDSRTIAIVGASLDPSRPSHYIAEYLQSQGYRIIPVNPNHAGQEILGETCVANLRDIREPVDLVDVFRRTPDVPPVADDAIAIGARAFWQQSGIANLDAHERVRAAGLLAVLDRCAMVEHRRWRHARR
jgi:predicted CoA-binding protein